MQAVNLQWFRHIEWICALCWKAFWKILLTVYRPPRSSARPADSHNKQQPAPSKGAFAFAHIRVELNMNTKCVIAISLCHIFYTLAVLPERSSVNQSESTTLLSDTHTCTYISSTQILRHTDYSIVFGIRWRQIQERLVFSGNIIRFSFGPKHPLEQCQSDPITEQTAMAKT